MGTPRAQKNAQQKPASQTTVSVRAKQPLNIFFLGDLGAGKATQSAVLAKKYKLTVIDMGIEQEKQRRQDPKIDAIFKKSVDAGKMNPTAIYRMLVKNAIERVPETRGIIFAGHPKMPNEVRYVARLMKKLGRTRIISVYVSIPWSETMKRNLKRKGYFGDKKRADDSLAALKIRRNFAQANLIKSQPIYKSLYPFKRISGMGTVAEVTARVGKTVESLLAQV